MYYMYHTRTRARARTHTHTHHTQSLLCSLSLARAWLHVQWHADMHAQQRAKQSLTRRRLLAGTEPQLAILGISPHDDVRHRLAPLCPRPPRLLVCVGADAKRLVSCSSSIFLTLAAGRRHTGARVVGTVFPDLRAVVHRKHAGGRVLNIQVADSSHRLQTRIPQ